MRLPEDLIPWVRRAQAGDIEAFGWLVRQFQDMAVGYAASILGDFHLAEDAAQEAFLEAWRDLPRLREPAAFAGWLRKILFKQCDRLTRGKRLPMVPLEAAADLGARQPGPAELAELQELCDAVQHAIHSLPEVERLVVLLFYISEYTQPEIAAFLGVSLITVKKRLAAARRRLKERMIVPMQDELRAQRPSRDERFADRVLAFSQGFSEMIDAGTSLVRSLEALAERQDDGAFKAAIEQINKEIQEGQTLSYALGRHPEFFNEQYVRAIRLGEVTGTLEIQLERLAAEEAFDFDGDDHPEKFCAESPTIVRLADGLLDLAISRGATEIQVALAGRGDQLHFVYLTRGVIQDCLHYIAFRPRNNIPAALLDRYRSMAGLADHADGAEGRIPFARKDGRRYDLNVSIHSSVVGQTIVMAVVEPQT